MTDYKDVQIGEKRYRIGKLTARNGSWIVAQLVTKMMPAGLEDSMGVVGLLSTGRKEMSESEFHNIQDHCLKVCQRYETVGEQEVPQTIMREDGKITFKDLESDLPTILGLTINTLLFNCAPFFSGDVLGKLLGMGSSASNPSSASS